MGIGEDLRSVSRNGFEHFFIAILLIPEDPSNVSCFEWQI